MKDLKISSKYDNHICTLENGEKLFSAEVTLHSSDKKFLEEFAKLIIFAYCKESLYDNDLLEG